MSFLEHLSRRKDDRGLLANLRCFLVESKKHRAWPALNRLGIDITDEDSSYVAGLFATHSELTDTGNFGTTCNALEQKRDVKSGEDKLTSTERRFQHLLSAEKGTELYGRITRLVLMAKQQGVPVNYEKLRSDLGYWNARTKQEWASAFWTPGAEPIDSGEDA